MSEPNDDEVRALMRQFDEESMAAAVSEPLTISFPPVQFSVTLPGFIEHITIRFHLSRYQLRRSESNARRRNRTARRKKPRP